MPLICRMIWLHPQLITFQAVNFGSGTAVLINPVCRRNEDLNTLAHQTKLHCRSPGDAYLVGINILKKRAETKYFKNYGRTLKNTGINRPRWLKNRFWDCFTSRRLGYNAGVTPEPGKI